MTARAVSGHEGPSARNISACRKRAATLRGTRLQMDGLSYGTFEYSDLTVDRDSVAPQESLTVSVRLTNAGVREATEVVQLYLHQRHGSASRPVRELKGFHRVTLAAGASQQVRFTLSPEHRRYWSATTRDWALDDTVFDVWVGGDSTARLSTTFAQNSGAARQ